MPELYSWPSLGFIVFVLAVLVLDLAVFHRDNKEITLREAALWTCVWALLALSFNALIWFRYGNQFGLEFLTGYLVEWSLSMDNVFVFAVVFSFFKVPLKYQYRVLFWGILGAIVMRLTFIALGTELIRHFEWVMLIFGGFLIYTAFKLAVLGDAEPEPESNILMRLAKRLFPVAKGEHGDRFFVIENGRRCMTPLFLVLLVIESTDVMFAVDSVPAIFGVTDEPFIVFTSNIFAILGLRALYFLLAGVMDMFRYLHYGLSAVLGFVGLKMIVEYQLLNHDAFSRWFEAYLWTIDGGKPMQPLTSLLVILSLLAVSIIASLIANRFDRGGEAKDAAITTDDEGDGANQNEAAASQDGELTSDEDPVADDTTSIS